jgi:UDP-N-acetylglucosamine 2-epimerase (non-hydrolysing)|tara:strand:+ start:3069 stop:4211 length:1143 start_codon:yes stop_codon:yes gene_type:complete
MKVMTILGIRPDWIMMCKVIERLDRDFEHILVHSGQHYSYKLDKIFFDELGVREPDYHLAIGSKTQGQQVGQLMMESEKVMLKEKPDLVLTFSDANPSMAAISATKIHIQTAHIEAGMRSYDWRMPEEKNRRVVDSFSDYFFTPTEISFNTLLSEGVAKEKIYLVSKTNIDVLLFFKHKIDNSTILETADLVPKEYFLFEMHRPENINDKIVLGNILKSLDVIYKKYGCKIIAPLHPRAVDGIKRHGFKIPNGVHVIDLVGYFDFNKLEKHALCTVADSGTTQEECCMYRTPHVTIRISTERPETAEIGSNIVVGDLKSENILNAVETMLNRNTNWPIPYWPGASNKIVDTLLDIEDEIVTPKMWWNNKPISYELKRKVV